MNQHLVVFYENDTFFCEQVATLVATWLHAGDNCIVICSQNHLSCIERNLPPLSDESQRRYMPVDARTALKTILVDGWPDQKRFMATFSPLIEQAFGRGSTRVRIVGEMVGLLCGQGMPEAALCLEDYWDSLARRHLFSLIYAYPVGAFSGKNLYFLMRNHPDIPQGDYRGPRATSFDDVFRNILRLQQKTGSIERGITQRKEIEECLLARENDLSNFLENSMESMHQLSPDGRILWANTAELRLLGYQPDEYIGQSIAEFHRDAEAAKRLIAALASGESVHAYPASLRCRDGSHKHVLLYSMALMIDSRLISGRCITREIGQCIERAQNAVQEQTEAFLHHGYESVEARVRQRTAELTRVNASLRLDIEESQLAEDALLESRDLLRELSAQQQRIREEERKSIARDLHDELGGVLTGMKGALSVVSDSISKDDLVARHHLDIASELLNNAIDTVHRVITDLRPSVLDYLGIWSAIEWYAARISHRNGLSCEFIIDEATSTLQVDPERSIALFRIVQEALTNVMRHSQATMVAITARCVAGVIRVTIRDNGTGFTQAQKPDHIGYGIAGMRERARYFGGDLSVEREERGGTCIALAIPL